MSLECKNSGVGKFAHDFSLADDGEGSVINISSNEVFSEIMNTENVKQEQISTNPFLDNEVIMIFNIILFKNIIMY